MSSQQNDIWWRIGVVYYLMIILGIVILSRVIYIQYAEGDYWKQKSNALTEKKLKVEPNRGDICAVDGRLLSSSVPYYEIRMDLKAQGLTKDLFDENIDSLSICLSDLFKDKSAKEYKRELINARARGSQYHLIKRKATYIELKKLKNFPIFKLGQNKGGLITIQNNKRVKPFSELASRTIGFLWESDEGAKEGRVGIEQAFNRELKGVHGLRMMQRIGNNIWMPVSSDIEVEPKDGNDVITTIDINYQDVAENALYKKLKSNGAQYGTVVLMEVETGDIKAIANLERDSLGEYHESYNYAIGASTEPGSTFKLISLLICIEDGFVKLTDTVDTEGGFKVYFDQKMKDSHEGGYGKISVKDVFAYSSNVGISKLVYNYYKGKEARFVDRLYKMHLNETLGIEIKGEGLPYIKNPTEKNWYGTTLPWMSVGYEVRLTPLQILTFYNAIANNGVMMKPRFVKALKHHGAIIKEYNTQVLNPAVCSKESVEKAHELLNAVVEYGTGKNLKNSIYKIAGKTGTAQIARGSSGYKDQDKITYQASFVGYFPADNPKFSCIVVINTPSNKEYYGNLVAAPIFKEIADRVYATSIDIHKELEEQEQIANNDVPHIKSGRLTETEFAAKHFKIKYKKETKNAEWIISNIVDSAIVIKNKTIKEKYVPNVTGMALSDAVFLLENLGLKVNIVGRGNIVKQSIEPNAIFEKNQKITLELS
jgi:cell division protein FtsI (penicillin-binding protein 3)